MLTTKRA